MSDKRLDKRLVTRLSDEHLEAVAEWAADEGVDNATMVRMIVDRLSKGRPPLLSMMEPPPAPLAARSASRPIIAVPPRLRAADDPAAPPPVADDALDAMMAQRLAELPEDAPLLAQAGMPPPVNGTVGAVAVSVRHVERTRYNPGG